MAKKKSNAPETVALTIRPVLNNKREIVHWEVSNGTDAKVHKSKGTAVKYLEGAIEHNARKSRVVHVHSYGDDGKLAGAKSYQRAADGSIIGTDIAPKSPKPAPAADKPAKPKPAAKPKAETKPAKPRTAKPKPAPKPPSGLTPLPKAKASSSKAPKAPQAPKAKASGKKTRKPSAYNNFVAAFKYTGEPKGRMGAASAEWNKLSKSAQAKWAT